MSSHLDYVRSFSFALLKTTIDFDQTLISLWYGDVLILHFITTTDWSHLHVRPLVSSVPSVRLLLLSLTTLFFSVPLPRIVLILLHVFECFLILFVCIKAVTQAPC